MVVITYFVVKNTFVVVEIFLNQLREKYFDYLLKKYEKYMKLIPTLKLSCAFGNYRTQNILHLCESSFPLISNILI